MELQKKSDCNFKSAGKLLDYQLYASSVHCSYYSCFQAVVAFYLDKSKRDYSEVQKEISDTKRKVHTYYIDKVCGIHISQSANINKHKESKTLRDLYKNLKELRVEADYHNVDMSESEAKKAFENCGQLIKKLNSLV